MESRAHRGTRAICKVDGKYLGLEAVHYSAHVLN
jgi:hypothetical protein